MQSSSPSQCHASFIHSRDDTQRNWLTAHSVGGRATPADTSDSFERRSASAAVQFCSSELSWQSMSPSHRQTRGTHCWLPHCHWSSSHDIGSDNATQSLSQPALHNRETRPNTTKANKTRTKLECGPMSNVMVALPNTSVQRRKVWLTPTTRCRAVTLPRCETR